MACKDKPAEEIVISSISISVSHTNINLGESVTFNIVDNLGRSLNSNVIVYVNGSAISGLTYQPSTEGTFSVNAKYQNISSNTISLNVTKLPPSSISVVLSKKNISLGQTVTLSVSDNYCDDITSESEIFVNNSKITGTTYTPAQLGAYEIYATFNQLQSDKEELNVYQFVQKALIEDYTGTWCGYCPRVMDAIELTLAQSEDVIPVAIHSSNGSAIDPFDFSDKHLLMSSFNFQGYPTARINRSETWDYPENTPPGINQVLSKLSTIAPLGLGISSNMNNGILNLNIEVGFASNQSNLKLVVYLLEDKLKASQSNYYEDLYGGASTLVNFEHNHVLRHCLTDLFGDAIPVSESTADHIFQRSFNFTVADSDISNSANVSIVVFVVNGNNGEVINVQKATVNETVAF